MAESKPPKLLLSEDKAASVRIWRRKFNAWCLLQRAWRDANKCPMTPDHWVAEKAQSEIAAFFLTLPDNVLEVFETTILAKMTTSTLPLGTQTLFTSSLEEMVCLQRILMTTMTMWSTHSQPVLFMTARRFYKYFTWLPVSVTPEKSTKVLMQVDSAASCNNLPSSVFMKISSVAPLKPSHMRIFPYSGEAIHPLGKVSLPCEGVSQFETLEFQVIDSACIPGKLAFISGRDSMRLGLLKLHKSRVFSSTTSDVKLPHIHLTSSNQTTLPQSAVTADLQPGHLQKDQLVTMFKDNFEGLGTVGQAVCLTLDPEVPPCHAGIHRVPAAKLEKVKAKLDNMVECGKLKKVDQLTNWCSNITVREQVLPDGTTKVRLCLDPSQTLNKAIIIPRY